MGKNDHEILKIHEAYFESKVKGFVIWLDRFDQNLKKGTYEVCTELLMDARNNKYATGDIEERYIDSRDGALHLCRGILLHKEKEYNQAESFYNKGMDIHQQVANLEGKGQALSLLDILRKDRSQGEVSLPLLQKIADNPWVLESDGAYLIRQLEGSEPHTQQKILQIALEAGHLEPLQR